MSTEGYVKFEYFSKGVPPYYGNNSFPELLDDESIVVKTPNIEMSYHQYFGLFKKFLMSVGFNEKNIMQGACSLAFNEMNDEKIMREVAEEYDLIMSEQLPEIIADSKKLDEEWIEKTNDSWEQRYWEVYHKLVALENVKYTDEELDEMCDKAASDEEKNKCREYNLREAEYYNKRAELDVQSADTNKLKVTTNDPMLAWNGLIPGSAEARAVGCICPVLDNEEMPDDKKWIDVECPIHGRK